jgi:glycolate oxidase
MLLVELDGNRSVVEAEARRICDDCTTQGALQVSLARTPEEAESLWSLRRSISSALYLLAPQKISEDICLPRSKLSVMFSAIKEIESKYRIPTATFGHAGDGNLHVHFLVSSPEQEAALPSAMEALFRRTTELGGTLSGEHGIGLTKLRYFSLEIMPEELRLMRALKQLIDPKGIMNPGKKIP